MLQGKNISSGFHFLCILNMKKKDIKMEIEKSLHHFYIYKVVISVYLFVCMSDHNSGTQKKSVDWVEIYGENFVFRQSLAPKLVLVYYRVSPI